MNKVADIVINYQHVGVAGDGRLDKAAGEVGEDFSGVGGKVGIEEVQFVVGGLGVGVGWHVVGIFLCEGGEVIGAWRVGGWCVGGCGVGFGGSLVGARLVEVAFDEGGRDLRVFANLGGCEVWPRGEQVGVDCFAPRGERRREQGGMVESNTIGECLLRNDGIRGVCRWSVVGVGVGWWQMELPDASGGGARAA